MLNFYHRNVTQVSQWFWEGTIVVSAILFPIPFARFRTVEPFSQGLSFLSDVIVVQKSSSQEGKFTLFSLLFSLFIGAIIVFFWSRNGANRTKTFVEGHSWRQNADYVGGATC